MRAKYGMWNDITNIRGGRNSSFLWKEICECAAKVLARTGWMIGDGSTMDMVCDAWLADIPLGRWPMMINTEMTKDMMVHDLFQSEERQWDVDQINRLLGDQLGERVMSLAIPIQACLDLRIWRDSHSVRASARNLYSLYKGEPTRRLDVV